MVKRYTTVEDSEAPLGVKQMVSVRILPDTVPQIEGLLEAELFYITPFSKIPRKLKKRMKKNGTFGIPIVRH